MNYLKQMQRVQSAQYKLLWNIGRPGALVLNVIGNYGPIYAIDVAKRSSVDKALVGRAVCQLTDKGYIIQKLDQNDKRRRTLILTKRRRNLFRSTRIMRQERYKQCLKCFKQSEVELIESFLVRLIDNANEMYETEISIKSS